MVQELGLGWVDEVGVEGDKSSVAPCDGREGLKGGGEDVRMRGVWARGGAEARRKGGALAER